MEREATSTETSMRTTLRIMVLGTAAAMALPSWTAWAQEQQKLVETGMVEGHVTYKGKPLEGGTIQFHPEKGKPIIVKLQAEGTYKAKDVPLGEVRVTVETESVNPANAKGGDKKDTAPAKDTKYQPIPAKFAKPDTSGLTAEVKKGKQTLDIDLQ
jgi:Rieske Fe-S protein